MRSICYIYVAELMSLDLESAKLLSLHGPPNSRDLRRNGRPFWRQHLSDFVPVTRRMLGGPITGDWSSRSSAQAVNDSGSRLPLIYPSGIPVRFFLAFAPPVFRQEQMLYMPK